MAAAAVTGLDKGTLIATHAERRRPDDDRRPATPRAVTARRARPATSGPSVARLADTRGNVSFAVASYRAGRRFARQSIDVAIVGGSVQLSLHGEVIRFHAIRHDRSKEHGAYATPNVPQRSPRSTCMGRPCVRASLRCLRGGAATRRPRPRS